MSSSEKKAQCAPVLIGPANCEAALGIPWRHARDYAHHLGVPLLKVGRKYMFRADLFVQAAERANLTPEQMATGELQCADPAAHVRALLGLKKRF